MSAAWRLHLPFLLPPPQHGEVEVDPEQDVDNEYGEESIVTIAQAANRILALLSHSFSTK